MLDIQLLPTEIQHMIAQMIDAPLDCSPNPIKLYKQTWAAIVFVKYFQNVPHVVFGLRYRAPRLFGKHMYYYHCEFCGWCCEFPESHMSHGNGNCAYLENKYNIEFDEDGELLYTLK